MCRTKHSHGCVRPHLEQQDSLRCPRRWADHSFYLFWVLGMAFVHRLRNKIWLQGRASEQLPLILPGSGQTNWKQAGVSCLMWKYHLFWCVWEGRGPWSSSFPLSHGGTEVNQPRRRIQPQLNSAALDILVSAWGAGIILCWLKTEQTCACGMALNWNFSLFVLGDGQTAFFPSSGEDFLFCYFCFFS